MTEDGVRTVRLQALWRLARRWARHHGYRYDGSYGVVGVAPT
jgi:hypothetical protein